jgi:hypothetical protein
MRVPPLNPPRPVDLSKKVPKIKKILIPDNAGFSRDVIFS